MANVEYAERVEAVKDIKNLLTLMNGISSAHINHEDVDVILNENGYIDIFGIESEEKYLIRRMRTSTLYKIRLDLFRQYGMLKYTEKLREGM